MSLRCGPLTRACLVLGTLALPVVGCSFDTDAVRRPCSATSPCPSQQRCGADGHCTPTTGTGGTGGTGGAGGVGGSGGTGGGGAGGAGGAVDAAADAPVPIDGPTGCTGNADCGSPTLGSWSSCSYGDACATSGMRSRSVTTPTCMPGGTCADVMTIETDTSGCGRSTDGTPCGSQTFGPCQYADPACSTTANRDVMTPLCSGGGCVTQLGTEVNSPACTRNTDLAPCGDPGGTLCNLPKKCHQCGNGSCQLTPGYNDACDPSCGEIINQCAAIIPRFYCGLGGSCPAGFVVSSDCGGMCCICLSAGQGACNDGSQCCSGSCDLGSNTCF